MPEDALREEEFQTRVEATVGIAAVIALQIALAVVSLERGWTLAGLPGWVWLLPAAAELPLLLLLAIRGRELEAVRRRRYALALVVIINVANAMALCALLVSILQLSENNGSELLFKGAVIWATNVLAYGLLYWELDRGGPLRRLRPDPPPRDFQFPQDENPSLAAPGWRAGLIDYVYVSFTNSIAFSPTDAMPLSQRAKAAMLSESFISAITLLFVAARAVNILKQ